MQQLPIGNSTLSSSRLIYGCMRIAENLRDTKRGTAAIEAALDAGYNHFDHADIYANGQSEDIFGKILKRSPSLRDNLIITTKAGIRRNPKRYDFSKSHLIQSVDDSLTRLNTDYVDLFLLHRPDYLMDAQCVAETIHQLQTSGKVKHFGVSNFTPSQLRLLQSKMDTPIIVNQVEINLHNITSLTDGTLDQCQELGITPMAWCPLGGVAYPAWGNQFSKQDELRISTELTRQAKAYACEPWQIALAWLLLHPANIMPIIGSTSPDRIRAASRALDIDHSQEDWYRLLEARNGYEVA